MNSPIHNPLSSCGGPAAEGEARSSRPFILGSVISNSPERVQKRDLRCLISSGVGDRHQAPFDIKNLENLQVRSPFQFSRRRPPRRAPLSGRSFPRNTADYRSRKAGLSSCIRQRLPVHASRARRAFQLILSAPYGGLAVVFNGQEDDRKKATCPTNVFPGAEKIFPRIV